MNRDFWGRLGFIILVYFTLAVAIGALCLIVISLANSTEANAQDNGDPNIHVVHVDVDGRQVTCVTWDYAGGLSCDWGAK